MGLTSKLETVYEEYLEGYKQCAECGGHDFHPIDGYIVACTDCLTEVDIEADYEDSRN